MAVSKDNQVAVISATDDSGTGNAYVYTRDAVSGQWITPPQTLPVPGDVGGYFQFGWSVAISNDSANRTILVSIRGESFGKPGAAYAFVLSGGNWVQQHEFLPTAVDNPPLDINSGDGFGFSVALSSDGNTALIASPDTNVAGIVHQGLVYVYTRSGATWMNTQTFTDSTPANDSFGYSVALSDDGTVALIGAENKNTYKGADFVYTGSAGNFPAASETLLAASDGANGNTFGLSVALSGDGKTAVVGAPYHNDPVSGNPTGSAYIFTNVGGTWGTPEELNETINTYYDYNAGAVAQGNRI